MKSLIACMITGLLFGARIVAAAPEVGQAAPKIAVGEWLSGELKGAGPFAGKTVVLEFWATWCRPCWAVIPHMNKLVEKFAGDDVVFVSMSHEKREIVERFRTAITMKARVALDQNDETSRSYSVETIPFMYLIDPNGYVRWKGHPAAFSEEQMTTYLSSIRPPESGAAAK